MPFDPQVRAASQTPPWQQAWPGPPQAQRPPVHDRPAAQTPTSPSAQQAWSGPPHRQTPWSQVALGPHTAPSQQSSPSAPQRLAVSTSSRHLPASPPGASPP